jgi:acetyl-CoA synthetase (ADP-forming)
MHPKKIFQKAREEGRRALRLDEAIQVIRYYKIPFASSRLVREVEEGAGFAKRIGYPVALKAVSADIVHKIDVGAVALDIANRAEFEIAYKKLLSGLKKNAPKAKIDGFLVQKMIKGGQEVIIGGKKDPQFGQTIMFGLGGIFVEIFKDVSFRICPIKKKDAQEMIREIKGYKILSGYRGVGCDIKALTDALLKSSRLLDENQEIEELDLNPIFALPRGAKAVDARIVIS